MPRLRYTRERQCERCGELDDGTCVCTELVVRSLPRPEPLIRSERREFLLNPARETDTWPWEV